MSQYPNNGTPNKRKREDINNHSDLWPKRQCLGNVAQEQMFCLSQLLLYPTSVSIRANSARFIRWDGSTVIIGQRFNYSSHLEVLENLRIRNNQCYRGLSSELRPKERQSDGIAEAHDFPFDLVPLLDPMTSRLRFKHRLREMPVMFTRLNPIEVSTPYFKFADQVAYESIPDFVSKLKGLVQAHHDAYNYGKILHRNINIESGAFFSSEASDGLLCDWDLAVNSGDPEHKAWRAGVWNFMSAKLLDGPEREHTYEDDWESILYLLFHECLKLPSVANGVHRRMFPCRDQSIIGVNYTGGQLKLHAMLTRKIPRTVTFKEQPALNTLVKEMVEVLAVRYDPAPTEEEMELFSHALKVDCRTRKKDLEGDYIYNYRKRLKRLKTPNWLLNAFKRCLLDCNGWPDGDKKSNIPELKVASMSELEGPPFRVTNIFETYDDGDKSYPVIEKQFYPNAMFETLSEDGPSAFEERYISFIKHC